MCGVGVYISVYISVYWYIYIYNIYIYIYNIARAKDIQRLKMVIKRLQKESGRRADFLSERDEILSKDISDQYDIAERSDEDMESEEEEIPQPPPKRIGKSHSSVTGGKDSKSLERDHKFPNIEQGSEYETRSVRSNTQKNLNFEVKYMDKIDKYYNNLSDGTVHNNSETIRNILGYDHLQSNEEWKYKVRDRSASPSYDYTSTPNKTPNKYGSLNVNVNIDDIIRMSLANANSPQGMPPTKMVIYIYIYIIYRVIFL